MTASSRAARSAPRSTLTSELTAKSSTSRWTRKERAAGEQERGERQTDRAPAGSARCARDRRRRATVRASVRGCSARRCARSFAHSKSVAHLPPPPRATAASVRSAPSPVLHDRARLAHRMPRCDRVAPMGERTEYAPGIFSWTDLSTTDPDAAKSFYAALLGWQAEDL